MYYTITLLIEDTIYQFPIYQGDILVLGSSSKDNVSIPELEDQKIRLYCSEFPELRRRSFPFWKKEVLKPGCKKKLDIGKRAALLVSETRVDPTDVTVIIPFTGSVTAGRAKANNICVNDSRMSAHHFIISCQDGQMELEDLDSRNGTYLNGKAVHKEIVREGDQIQTVSTIFQVGNHMLVVKNDSNTKNDPIIYINQPEEQESN